MCSTDISTFLVCLYTLMLKRVIHVFLGTLLLSRGPMFEQFLRVCGGFGGTLGAYQYEYTRYTYDNL